MGVVIHPELLNEILRPMVNNLAQLDLTVLSSGKKTAISWDKKYYYLPFSSM